MRKFIRLIAKIIVFLMADVTAIGKEHLPPTGSFIAASNHLGRLDALLTLTIIDRTDIILMIAEKYQAYAIWRFVVKHLNALWLNRYETDFHALRVVIKRIQQGEFLVIAPEGTRSKQETLIEGKSGTAYIAAKTGAPIIPIAIYGTEDRIIKQNLRHLRRSKIVVQAGEPFTLPPLDYQNRDLYLQTQTDEIMCRIAAMLPEKYRGAYADSPRLRMLLQHEK